MPIERLITIIWLVAAFSAVYWPRLILGNQTAYSIRELEAINSAMGSAARMHVSLGAVWALVTGVAYLIVAVMLRAALGDKVMYFMASWFSLIAVFDGLFAKLSGIYSVSEKVAYRYLIDNSECLARVGLIQALFGFAIALVSTLMALL